MFYQGIQLLVYITFGWCIKGYKAIGLDSQFPLTWYKKGDALTNLGNYEEVAKAYKKAFELSNWLCGSPIPNLVFKYLDSVEILFSKFS
mgnify:CR=1 FL=1